ncbi:MAG: XRE family transcriptional regulator [Acidobacteriia bacterium]|nr:XRE family transcriptional regulator [Terriglobia bacterium]
MSPDLQLWRNRNGLTQVEAATRLGVSQPYLSLLEKGARPLTEAVRKRLTGVSAETPPETLRDDRFRAELSALGYPGFAHIPPAKGVVHPDVLLNSVLSLPDADARIITALPWVARNCWERMNLPWLVRQAKLANLQNRLGFILQLGGADSPQVAASIAELARARLLHEDTMCWDSMQPFTRSVFRERRSLLAKNWNIVTLLTDEAVEHVG